MNAKKQRLSDIVENRRSEDNLVSETKTCIVGLSNEKDHSTQYEELSRICKDFGSESTNKRNERVFVRCKNPTSKSQSLQNGTGYDEIELFVVSEGCRNFLEKFEKNDQFSDINTFVIKHLRT